MVENIYANQSEAKFMTLPLKSCHICPSGKSINWLYQGKNEFTSAALIFLLLNLNFNNFN